MKKPTPLHDRVIVVPDPKLKERGGILIPDTARTDTATGTVYAVAPESKNFQPLVKEGDRVKYGKHAGTEIDLQDQEGQTEETIYLVMRESDISCII